LWIRLPETYVQFIPTKNIEASTGAQVLYENVICRFGCFKTLVSGRGTQFLSELFQQLHCSDLLQQVNFYLYRYRSSAKVKHNSRVYVQRIT
jgi:hypothetical protein